MQNQKILSILESKGIPKENVMFNGNFLSFPYLGMIAHFAQLPGGMIKSHFFREPTNEEEEFLVRQAPILANRGDSYGKEFRDVFAYEEFEGHLPLEKEVVVTMALIEATRLP